MNRTTWLTASAVALLFVAMQVAPTSAALINVAPSGTATQSTTSGSFAASRGIDGIKTGSQPDITHTNIQDASPWWQLDLGSSMDIDSIDIYNRTDCCSGRLRDFTVDILAADGITVNYTSGLLNPGNSLGGGVGNYTLGPPNPFNVAPVSPVTGQFVRISRTPEDVPPNQDHDETVISLAEVEVFVDAPEPPVNLALLRPTWQSSAWAGFNPLGQEAVDGPTTNNTHTAGGDTPATWEVDLGGQPQIETIVLHNRDNCCGNRLRDVTVSIINDGGTEVFNSGLLNPGNAMGSPATIELDIVALAGSAVAGGTVRVVRTADGGGDDNIVLALGEVQIYGDGPTNVALGKPATQSTVNPGYPADYGVDGNTGNFTHTLNTDTAPTWEVDLEGDFFIEDVVLHNRDSCCGERLRDITVRILNGAGVEVFSSPLTNPENTLASPQWLLVDVAALNGGTPVAGASVQILRTLDSDNSGNPGTGQPLDDASILSIGEVTVFGTPVPEPGAAVLLLIGLCGLIGVARRR